MNEHRVGIAEARRRLSELINRVAFGEERVVFESRGKAKAALVSLEDLQKLNRLDLEAAREPENRWEALRRAKEVREAIREMRAGQPLPDSGEVLGELRESRAHEL